MTIFVFFLGALLGFFWLLLLQTLFWNLPKSDSRSHYQKVNKVSDNHWFFLLPTRWPLPPLYWVFACLCYGGLCGVAFHDSESLLAFVWQEKMGGGDLLVLAGWSIWLAPSTLLALLLVASSLGLLAFFGYQGIWKKRLAQLPFVPFLSLGLLIVRFLAFHTFDAFFL